MAERRRRISPASAAAAATAVSEAVREDPRVRRAKRIALYAALGDELPTRPLFEALRSRGAVCLFPRFAGDAMEWARVDTWDALVRGRFGVLEPAAAGSEVLERGDVALLPGLAFDRQGWRLGRGGGHYDRAFAAADASRPWLVGVGYSFQWVEEVPHDDSRDRRVDAIVTESGWMWRARGSK
jgi:5-formyltetrahydrofolate cyclo-ligase